MSYPPYWTPPPFMYGMPPTKPGMTIEDILAAENQLKMLKDAFKKEADDKKKDDDKKKGPKAPSFTIGGLLATLSIGSIPMVLLQLWMLGAAKEAIFNFLK